MGASMFARSFTQSRATLALWYVAFCLALIAVMNFGAFAAQTTSLNVPAKSIGFGALTDQAQTPARAISIAQDDNSTTLTTTDSLRQSFGRTLMIVDALLIILSIILSYILSGVTLRPIRKTLEDQAAFAQEVSHELRTPLGVMALELEALKRSDPRLAARQAEAFAQVDDELRRMSILVDELLILVQPEDKAKATKTVTTFDVTAAAKTAFAHLQKVAETKGIGYRLTTKAAGNVRGHRQDIEQVVTILLDNALKYTAKGGTVSLAVEPAAGHEVLIQVTDTGRGIPAADLPHIFDRFYRSSQAAGLSTEGIGLGLAIAKKRITFHGGRITADSQEGQGTTMSVYLPLA